MRTLLLPGLDGTGRLFRGFLQHLPQRRAPAALFRRPMPAFAISRFLVGAGAPASLVGEVRDAISEVAPEVLAHRLRLVAAIDAGSAFAALRIPILYLAGTRDRLVGTGVAPLLRSLNPALEVASLDSPHLLLQRCPAEAAGVVRDFFDRRSNC